MASFPGQPLSREFGVALPWELLYAGGLVVMAETGEDLIEGLSEWRGFVGGRRHESKCG